MDIRPVTGAPWVENNLNFEFVKCMHHVKCFKEAMETIK